MRLNVLGDVILKNSAFQLILALLIPIKSNRHLRERHWQKYDRVAMRVAEVWEGFRVACFAPPVPETTGDFREDCLRASTNETFCATFVRARVPQRPVVSSNARYPGAFAGATTLGSPSFGYFSWRSKKRSEHCFDVFLPPGNPRHRSRNK